MLWIINQLLFSLFELTSKCTSIIIISNHMLFINDVSSIFKELDVKPKLFADDIKLYSSYDVHGSQLYLITAVNRLYEPMATVDQPNCPCGRVGGHCVPPCQQWPVCEYWAILLNFYHTEIQT